MITVKYNPGDEVYVKVKVESVTIDKVSQNSDYLIDLSDNGHTRIRYKCLIYDEASKAVATLYLKECDMKDIKD